MAPMTARIFIDGQVGTTGLRIRDWLVGRDDLELLEIDESRRKQPAARRECLEAADLAVLCLPDDAALEAAGWLRDAPTRILDASTAHRVAADWVYGLPELEASQRAAIRAAKRCRVSPVARSRLAWHREKYFHSDPRGRVRQIDGGSGDKPQQTDLGLVGKPEKGAHHTRRRGGGEQIQRREGGLGVDVQRHAGRRDDGPIVVSVPNQLDHYVACGVTRCREN